MNRRSILLPRIKLRRRFPMPRPPTFIPRELTHDEHATLAAMSARGQWDRDAAKRARNADVTGLLIEHARVLFRRNHAQAHAVGPMPPECSWGGR